ncbi:3013_t:CDS:2 [Acaulospora morrowiae]|uniref:3013_t:CDS:1 n=1 Tax=Acaulospora morrowiae TaxID=94023 RepID=A0A9N9AEJ4_9GLOM|nr:3013_t:CDS:2 [Acaulospora morrowiae]
MDYFKNLRSRIAPQRAQPTPAEHLAKFRKSWDYIRAQFENEGSNYADVPHHLRQMIDLLVDEGLRLEDVNTGLCMEEFLRNKILDELVNYAEIDVPKGIRGEIIRTFGSMIDLLDDRFLVHNAVHQPTVSLLRMCVHDIHDDPGDKYDEELVDLMYHICSKIHSFPALLNIFFHDTHWLTTPQKAYLRKESESSSSNGDHDGNQEESALPENCASSAPTKTTEFTEDSEKPEYEFLLFTYLLKFLHKEGRSGEYARYGLLFIIELAEDALGDFIIESDFATIMAAGLGALYSQLPRKLMVKSSGGGLTNATLLGFGDIASDELEGLRANNIQVSSSPEFINQLDSFLKLMEFCQDVLNICPNVDISLALLQNVKTHFLKNILYPSILECSDKDGSAVAVISYIDIIMQTLSQEDLVDMVVGFLMDSDGDDEEFWKQAAVNKMAKRQSTINLFEGIEASPIKSSPYFTAEGRFTLKDLIFSRLRSSSEQTVIATLKLLHTVISKHCRYSLKLLNIELDENATCFPRPNYLFDESYGIDPHGSLHHNKKTTISHHLKELDLFFSLVSAIDPTKNMDVFTNGYESYVRDAEMIIEADVCYINGLDVEWTEDGPIRPKTNKSNGRRLLKKGNYRGMSGVRRHRLNPTDRVNPNESLLQILLGTLSNFFAHSPELNLTLTRVLSALAVCPYRSLEGWLVFSGTDRLDKDNRRDSNLKDFESLQNEAKSLELSIGIASHDGHINDGDSKPINDFDENDDRSIDFDADKSPSATKAIGATPMWTNFPPFFTIFKTLTQQVDYYRSEIDGFNQYLVERRNKLLDADDGIDENFFRQPAKKANHPPNSNVRNRSNTSPSQKSRRARADSASNPPSNTTLYVSPLPAHFQETENIKIQPLFPTHFVNADEEEDPTDPLDDEEDDAPRKQTRTKTKESKPKEISLSTLLNNVVILEEAIKELVAIVQVRRSLGIDEVRYL